MPEEQQAGQTLQEKSLSEREKALIKASRIFEQRIIPHFAVMNDALDLGTGNGHTTFTLTKHFKNVVSVDTDSECLERAVAKAQDQAVGNLRVLAMDAHNLDFPDEAFDVVTCRAAIHHFEDGVRVLEEVRRILRPGGFFVLMDFCFSDMSKGPLAVLSRIREDDFRRYYTFHEYCDLLEVAGLPADTIYTYTLPRFIREWAAVAPTDVQERIVNAFLALDERVHSELRLHREQDQPVMTYRILEFVCRKS